MRRITGAAALAYVVLAAIENMELLGLPGLGAPAAEVRAAYADTALGVVTVSAGALSLLAYVVFAAALRPRWLWRGGRRAPAWPARASPQPRCSSPAAIRRCSTSSCSCAISRGR